MISLYLTGGSEVTCAVWLEGLDFSQTPNHEEVEEENTRRGCGVERWAVGTVRISPATLWTALEDALTSLALHHWDTLARYVCPS